MTPGVWIRIVSGMKKDVAKSAEVSLETGDLWIDGVHLPWWLARVDPEVRCDGLLEFTITFLVDGPVTIRPELGGLSTTHEPLFGGPVADYVRDQLRARLPWLTA